MFVLLSLLVADTCFSLILPLSLASTYSALLCGCIWVHVSSMYAYICFRDGRTNILQLYLKCLNYDFCSVSPFFLISILLFGSRAQSFIVNVCACACFFSPSLSNFFSSDFCMYVCMFGIWTQDNFKGFYKLFTNKIHTFSIFSLHWIDDHLLFFHYTFVSMLFRLHIKLQLLPEFVFFFVFILSPSKAFSACIKSLQFVSLFWNRKSRWRIAKNTQRKMKK